MVYTALNRTNTLLTNAMQFMSSVLWVMTKREHRGTDAQEVKAGWPKINSVVWYLITWTGHCSLCKHVGEREAYQGHLTSST